MRNRQKEAENSQIIKKTGVVSETERPVFQCFTGSDVASAEGTY